jgi:hypothetical protein
MVESAALEIKKLEAGNHFESHLSFNTKTGTLIIRIPTAKVDIEQRCKQYKGKEFEPKEEFHITVIHGRLGEWLMQFSTANYGFLQSLKELIINTNWTYEIGNEYRHVAKEKESANEEGVLKVPESIILNVMVPEIQNFFSRLSDLARKNIPVPIFPHITLYTYHDRRGIRIYDAEDFNNRVKEIITLKDLQDI